MWATLSVSPVFLYSPKFILKFPAVLSITNYEVWIAFPQEWQGEFCLEFCLLNYMGCGVHRAVLIYVLEKIDELLS